MRASFRYQRFAQTATKNYNPDVGAEYAQRYYLTPNPNFYYAKVDCTNFVSQCIWAAYGGWYPEITQEQMVENINNKISMVAGTYANGWYGNQGGGTHAWENVDALWWRVTTDPYLGPKAVGLNYGKNYKEIDPLTIQKGDVVQLSLNGYDYHHSAYVVKAADESGSLDTIYVAQHTKNVIRTLSDAIAGNGGDDCYMSLLQFQDALFQQ